MCKNCGFYTDGNGYTNHCPKCLYSVHVDISPGDRANSCKGLMKPIGVVLKNGKTQIVHKCLSCGSIAVVHSTQEDDSELLIKLSQNIVSLE